MTREDELEQLAISFGLHPDSLPEVDVVREVSTDELRDVTAECMTEQGFPPVREGGQMYWETPDGQLGGLNMALYVCQAKYPVAERYRERLTTAQLNVVYDHLVEVTVPCIRNLGYDITDPPSRERFVEREGAWEEFSAVESQVVQDATRNGRWQSYQEFLDTCPPMPPEDVLYGG